MDDSPVQTRSSRASSSINGHSATIIVTEPSTSLSMAASTPNSRILAASGQSPTSISTEETAGPGTTGLERRSRAATRSTSHTRDPAPSRTSRARARTRALAAKTPKVPGGNDEKSDDDDDDEDEARMRYHLRPPSHHRRRRSSQRAMPQETATETLPATQTPRLTRLGARHESGHDLEDEADQEQLPPKRHLDKVGGEHNQPHGRRSRSATSSSSQDSQAVKSKGQTGTFSPSGAHVTPRKIKKKTPDHHEVPSLPPTHRRLRARTTKIAKMGIDEGNGACDDDEEDEEEEEEEEDDDDEEAVEYDAYTRNDPDEEMRDADKPSPKLQARQAVPEDTSTIHDTADGFIASKPEVPTTVGGGLNHYLNQQAIHHAKRKVEDEDMEDAPSLSMDEAQVVSTKLARIDEASDGDRNVYLKTFYNILKSPRGDDDEGILSSESEDADLESEDDEDDFEEIDVWEFIATLPPLGPLPQNFIFTMPERTESTPPITLVLDIDETLVHCATRPLDSPDIVFPVEYNHETWEVYGRIRPGMYEFLEKMSTKFEVITFTASQECYAEALLKIIDPEKKFIKHRYYRDSCVPVFGNYVKDLRILNRDLSKVVIVDNSPQAFGYQISNGVPIESWYDDKSDRELAKLMTFLDTLHGVDDVRPMIDGHYKLHERIHKTVTLANHQQISSMSGLGNLGATLTPLSASTSNAGLSDPSSVSNVSGMATADPSHADMDATMMYTEMEKPPSPSDEDDEREDDEEKGHLGLSRKKKGTTGAEADAGAGSVGGGGGGTHAMTMTTRSNSQAMDAATNLAKISL
ncbi:hypothetical protein BGX33_002316 [Mortierella sp. NVP41]|nr:hypothetical protein BGX33_002316 [Mortierella sp. NVP41]